MISVNRDRKHIVVNLFGLKIKFKKKLKLKPLTKSGITEEKRDVKLIASLTSFPARINVVSKTIHTLLQQTVKPDEVVLWLAGEQFPKKEAELPQDLLDLRKFGLSIKWCEDIKSYKKLIPTLKEYPNDIIITFDDDLYYNKDCIEKLYNAYLEDSSYIYAHRISRLRFYDDLLKTDENEDTYIKNYNFKANSLDKLTGCGGVLYPLGSLHQDVLRDDIFMDICKNNDDIWFWLMGLLAGYKVKMVKNSYFRPHLTESSQGDHSICSTNHENGNNSLFITQTNAVIKKYPQLKEILKED